MSRNRISPIGFESVSQTTATPSVKIGSRAEDDAGNEYIYVYNAGSEIWPGRCAYLKTNSSSYTISDTNTAAGVGVFAGAVHHATIPTAYYGWIMTRGLAAVSPDTNAVSFNVDEYLTVGVDAGYTVCPATLSTAHRIGYTVSSGITSDGTLGVATMGGAWIRSDVW